MTAAAASSPDERAAELVDRINGHDGDLVDMFTAAEWTAAIGNAIKDRQLITAIDLLGQMAIRFPKEAELTLSAIEVGMAINQETADRGDTR